MWDASNPLTGTAAPDVSVVIPTHNRPTFLDRAVNSCALQVTAVSRLEVEVLVVDDGSVPPARVSAVPGIMVRTVRLEANRGRNAARNCGLEMASGRYVLFLDDDDALEPDALAREVAAADAESADVLVCRWRSAGLDEFPGRIFDGGWSGRGMDSLLAGEGAPTGAVLYRRTYLAEVRWAERLWALDDWDFFARAVMRDGRVVSSDIIAYNWTSHPGQGVAKSPRLANVRAFYAVLDGMRSELERRGAFTHKRRLRLAQYLYKELRFLARFDRDEFERRCSEILDLDPHFLPVDEERRPAIRWLCRAVGLRTALRLYARIRTLVTSTP
jgi:glycosyltransferase involved in cell wall biosynthesis